MITESKQNMLWIKRLCLKMKIGYLTICGIGQIYCTLKYFQLLILILISQLPITELKLLMTQYIAVGRLRYTLDKEDVLMYLLLFMLKYAFQHCCICAYFFYGCHRLCSKCYMYITCIHVLHVYYV